MSRRAWLTPDAQPETRQCWRVFVPDDPDHEAAFRGALHLLSLSWNWEQHGTATPESTAQLWVDANYETFKMENCSEGNNGVEIGTVFFFPSSTPPTGALVCDGSQISKDDYPYLFGLLGYTYGGSGDNFALPDLRGKFLLSASAAISLSATGGEENHQLTVAEMPEHNHGIGAQVDKGGDKVTNPVLGWRPTAFLTTMNEGDGTPHNNMPPYMALVAMIQAS